MVFYLKVNRQESWALKCLQHWVNTVEALPGTHEIYLLCDRQDLKERIEEEIVFSLARHEFLESDRDSSELTGIVSRVADKEWAKAAYAHPATFSHACSHGYPAGARRCAGEDCFPVSFIRGVG